MLLDLVCLGATRGLCISYSLGRPKSVPFFTGSFVRTLCVRDILIIILIIPHRLLFPNTSESIAKKNKKTKKKQRSRNRLINTD